METGQDLQLVMYPPDGFDLGSRHYPGSFASEISRLYAEAAILAFSNSRLGRFFPISSHPDRRKFPSMLHPSVGF